MSSSSAPAATSTEGDSSQWNNAKTSGDLYLYTFLATLILLLGISTFIVVRGLYMRRRALRRRRLIQERIEEEFMVPRGDSSRKKLLARKPRLHDTWVEPGAGVCWSEIMPISLTLLRKRPRISQRKDSKDANVTPTAPVPLWKQWIRRKNAIPCVKDNQTPNPPTGDASSGGHLDDEKIAQISVLVTMPSITRSQLYSSYSGTTKEPEYIPGLALGVTRLPFIKAGYPGSNKEVDLSEPLEPPYKTDSGE